MEHIYLNTSNVIISNQKLELCLCKMIVISIKSFGRKSCLRKWNKCIEHMGELVVSKKLSPLNIRKIRGITLKMGKIIVQLSCEWTHPCPSDVCLIFTTTLTNIRSGSCFQSQIYVMTMTLIMEEQHIKLSLIHKRTTIVDCTLTQKMHFF